MLLSNILLAIVGQELTSPLEKVFGGGQTQEPLELYQIASRAAVIYLGGIIIVRYGKSRLISRTTSLDVILGFILGSLLSRGITGHASISGTLLASVVIVGIHWLLTALACRSHSFGKFFKGNEHLVVENGEMLMKPMRHSHISIHDLVEQMRLHGIGHVDDVQQAFKERNGEISFIRREPQPKVVDVSVQNGVQTVRIAIE